MAIMKEQSLALPWPPVTPLEGCLLFEVHASAYTAS